MDELQTEKAWRKAYAEKMRTMLGHRPEGPLFGWFWFVDGVKTDRDTFDRTVKAGEGSGGVLEMDHLLCIGSVTFEVKPYVGLTELHDEMMKEAARLTAPPPSVLYPRVTPLRNAMPRTVPGSSYRLPRSVNWDDWPSKPEHTAERYAKEYQTEPANCRCVLTPVDVWEMYDTRVAVADSGKQAEPHVDQRAPCDCRKPAPVDGSLQDANGRFYECAGCRGRVPYLRVVGEKLALRPAAKEGKPVFDPAPPGLGALK